MRPGARQYEEIVGVEVSSPLPSMAASDESCRHGGHTLARRPEGAPTSRASAFMCGSQTSRYRRGWPINSDEQRPKPTIRWGSELHRGSRRTAQHEGGNFLHRRDICYRRKYHEKDEHDWSSSGGSHDLVRCPHFGSVVATEGFVGICRQRLCASRETSNCNERRRRCAENDTASSAALRSGRYLLLGVEETPGPA